MNSEEVEAERVKCQIERHLEIAGEMGACDLLTMGFQIIDQSLTETTALSRELFVRCRPGPARTVSM